MHKHRIILFLLVILALLMLPTASSAQFAVGVSVRIGPPVLPVYEQPICPGPSYLWTPGYWAYGPDGYYWVPGTWVVAPAPGLLWTPGYWGWGDGVYVWHAGYWGPHVGFYGGINYGFGYYGTGFDGGRWEHGVFAYNTAVWHVNTVVIHNTYIDRTVIHERDVNRVSFNGGRGGVDARPTRDEERWAQERHVEATHEQAEHEHAARSDRSFLASENHGHPAVAASTRAGEFRGHDVVATRGNSNSFHPPAHNEGGGHSFHPPAHNEGGTRSFNPPSHNEPVHSNASYGRGGNANRESAVHENPSMRPSHEGGNASARMDSESRGGGRENPRAEARPNNPPREERKPEKPHQ